MRFHTQTAGVSLTAQQPLVNIVRTTIEALAGVLGGTQSLHTNSYDEALALPTEEAVRLALRTQQVIAHESGVANTIDPLGGSYFVETLTDEMERAAYEYFARDRRARRHGRGDQAELPAARDRRRRRSATRRRCDDGERIVVGVNEYRVDDDEETPILRIDPALERKQVGRLEADAAAARRGRGRARARGAQGAPPRGDGQPDAALLEAPAPAPRRAR